MKAKILPGTLGLILLFSVLLSPSAHAWNAMGHMAVAGLAYDRLTPTTRARVNALLARHRDFPKWMAALPAGYKNRARYAFMKAATWPDDIRKTPEDRPIWHYSDLPVIAPGYTPDPLELLPLKPNAETQIVAETKLLAEKTAGDQARAIALCWVEHLVGDIHQPLHSASLFSPLFPKGDRGGNSELLLPGAVSDDPIEKAAHPHNLHALWDDLLGITKDPARIDLITAGLKGPAFAPSTYPQLASHPTVHEWLVESNALAKAAYVGGKIALTPKSDGKANVTLPAGYLPKAHQVANRQIALASLRLAALLNAQTFPSVSSAPLPSVPSVTQSPSAKLSDTAGQIIGNKRSHVYHLPGEGGSLPAERNRVRFHTEAEAQSAGYRKVGG